MERQLINIILLGLAFMILLTSYQTTTLISQSVLEGVKNETGFHGSGYIGTSMSSTTYSIVNVFAPVIVSIAGPTISMFLGAITYLIYIVTLIYPLTWSFYIASIFVGFGAALLWNGQGVYLSLNSNDLTISRNSGIFWAIYQSSLFPGNIYVYLAVKTDIIDHTKRYPLFSIFSIVAAISLIVFIILIFRTRIEKRQDNIIKNEQIEKTTLASIGRTLKVSIILLKTRNMLLLTIIFFYIGLLPGFFVVVYSTCIGHYKKYGGKTISLTTVNNLESIRFLDTRKRLIGLHGILIGVGEVSGGGLFGFITKPKTSSQRALIIVFCFILQIIYFYLTFVNIPSDASINETNIKPYIDWNSTTSQVITFIGSVLIGLGDSGYNTEIMNVLGSRYKKTSASAFAIFKLTQALAVAVALSYAGFLVLEWQLLILIIFSFIATLAFFVVIFDDKTTEILTSVPVQEYSETS